MTLEFLCWFVIYRKQLVYHKQHNVKCPSRPIKQHLCLTRKYQKKIISISQLIICVWQLFYLFYIWTASEWGPMEIRVYFANKLLNCKIKYVHVTTFRTVMTILFTAAADRSSPLGWSTRVMPRWRRLKVKPSMMVSRVSVQFSGSSGDKWNGFQRKEDKFSVYQFIQPKSCGWIKAILFLMCYSTSVRGNGVSE